MLTVAAVTASMGSLFYSATVQGSFYTLSCMRGESRQMGLIVFLEDLRVGLGMGFVSDLILIKNVSIVYLNIRVKRAMCLRWLRKGHCSCSSISQWKSGCPLNSLHFGDL